MKLNAPKFLTWLIGIILLAVGLLLFLGVFNLSIGAINLIFWLPFAGGCLIALGCMFKGL
jgi:hypothetical protein